MFVNNDAEQAKQRLTADFKAIIADGEELLHATAGQAGEKAGMVRDRIQKNLRIAKPSDIFPVFHELFKKSEAAG